MMTADVRSRVESDLKMEATTILKASGLDMSTAIRLFLLSIVEAKKMPIDLPKPNKVTMAAIQAAKRGQVTETTLEDF
jgi:DNA-damage-inducible protein J